jgi:hypothetical protein
MLDYIKNTAESAQKNNREKSIYADKLVYVKDQLSYGINLDYVLSTVESLVPNHLVTNIDSIYIGKFKDIEEKQFNALYDSGVIYVANDQDNENDMIDDIVHEIGHAVEEQFGEYIYGDGILLREFRAKREILYTYLKANGWDPPYDALQNPDYQEDLDKYFYDIIGYPTLSSLTVGVFYSPYAATSLREYFANGFENYFIRSRENLKELSPILYNKIDSLHELEER